MPNWVDNKLSVTGDSKDLKRFVMQFKPFSFETFVPMPKDPETQLEESRFCIYRFMFLEEGKMPEFKLDDAWYYWRLQHWGSKWDMLKEADEDGGEFPKVLIDEECRFTMSFLTPWAGPTYWVNTVSKMFPRLTFTLLCVDCVAWRVVDYCVRDGMRLYVRSGAPEDFEEFNDSIEKMKRIKSQELSGFKLITDENGDEIIWVKQVDHVGDIEVEVNA